MQFPTAADEGVSRFTAWSRRSSNLSLLFDGLEGSKLSSVNLHVAKLSFADDAILPSTNPMKNP